MADVVKSSNQKNKFVCTKDVRQADFIIYRACGHLLYLEDKSIRDIKKLLSLKKSEARLIVWGCLPQINPESLKEVYSGPLIGAEEAMNFFSRLFSLPKKKDFDSFLKKVRPHCIPKQEEKRCQPQTGKFLDLVDYFLFKSSRLFHFGRNQVMDRMLYIKIVSGCRNKCTYCSDRLVYKTVKSVPVENVIEQFKFGLDNGYRNFFLVGRDLGAYGYDIGTNLAILLEKVIESTHQADFKIFLRNVSPKSLIALYPELMRVFASDKICYFGSHIQSGSPRILKLMGKTLTLRKWADIIRDIQKRYPRIELETSMMVGFPSETDEDYQKSLNLLSVLRLNVVAVYKYNERPNIPSLRIGKRIPEIIKAKRYNQMKRHLVFNGAKKGIRRGHPFTLTDLNSFVGMTYILLSR